MVPENFPGFAVPMALVLGTAHTTVLGTSFTSPMSALDPFNTVAFAWPHFSYTLVLVVCAHSFEFILVLLIGMHAWDSHVAI